MVFGTTPSSLPALDATQPISAEGVELLIQIEQELDSVRRELDTVVLGLHDAGNGAPADPLSEAVRLDGMARARTLLARAAAVLERANQDARLTEGHEMSPSPLILGPTPAHASDPVALNGLNTDTTDPEPPQDVLELAVQPPDGDFLRYLVRGPLTFAALLSLKRAVAEIGGVRSVRVAPRPEGTTILTLLSDDPEKTLRELLSVPEFPMRLATE